MKKNFISVAILALGLSSTNVFAQFGSHGTAADYTMGKVSIGKSSGLADLTIYRKDTSAAISLQSKTAGLFWIVSQNNKLQIGACSSKLTTTGALNISYNGSIDIGNKVGIGIADAAAMMHAVGNNSYGAAIFESRHIYGMKDGVVSKTKVTLNNTAAYNASLFKASFEGAGIGGYAYTTMQNGTLTHYVQGNGQAFFSGSVGIGCKPLTDATLAVNGTVKAKKVSVTMLGFPDYVFAADYQLRPLSEVESFINEHKHLPEVPSEKEVVANGLDIGDTQALLMKKMEEMTLYIIQLEKRVNELEAKNNKE
jgi:hypothetical protein